MNTLHLSLLVSPHSFCMGRKVPFPGYHPLDVPGAPSARRVLEKVRWLQGVHLVVFLFLFVSFNVSDRLWFLSHGVQMCRSWCGSLMKIKMWLIARVLRNSGKAQP